MEKTIGFVADRRNKILKVPEGFEDYTLELDATVSQSVVETAVSNYFSGGGTSTVETIDSPVQVQRWASTVNLTQRPQTVTFASLGFPGSISHYTEPSVIQWCDRMISIQSFDADSVTLYPSMLGTDDFPWKVGLELVGMASVIPDYVYYPVAYADLRADRGVFVKYCDEESFTLEAFHTVIDELPINVAVFITGKEATDDGERQEWCVNVTLTDRIETFEYSSVSAKSDDYAYDIEALLETAEQTFNWNSFNDAEGNVLPAYLENSRIAKLSFKAECGAYVYECTSGHVILKQMHWFADDLPVKFNLQVRGGANA